MLKTSDKGLIFDAHQKLFLSFQVLKRILKVLFYLFYYPFK